MDGLLSQDEINALLSGMSGSEEPAPAEDTSSAAPVTDDAILTDSEKDAVGEISNISMGTAATTLSSLLNQKVNITTPKVTIVDWDELASNYDRPCVLLQISYKEGLDGSNILIVKEKDVKIITDLMMGGAGDVNDDEPLSELHLSAISEAMNQMMGSSATSLSSMFGRKIDISPPIADMVELYSQDEEAIPEVFRNKFVKVAFRMQIGELIDSEIMQLYPINFAKDLLDMFSVDSGSSEPEPAPAAPAAPAQAAPAAPQPQMQQPMMQQPMMDMSQMQQPMMQQPMMGYPGQMPMGYGMPQMGYGMPPMQDVNVQPAAFQPFAGDLVSLSQKENIDLIMDVPLEVTVELGRTQKSIKDILELAPGTIVELNKIAGEAIDVLVNGKYVAKGEVVVIEESFGVRITEIIK